MLRALIPGGGGGVVIQTGTRGKQQDRSPAQPLAHTHTHTHTGSPLSVSITMWQHCMVTERSGTPGVGRAPEVQHSPNPVAAERPEDSHPLVHNSHVEVLCDTCSVNGELVERGSGFGPQGRGREAMQGREGSGYVGRHCSNVLQQAIPHLIALEGQGVIWSGLCPILEGD